MSRAAAAGPRRPTKGAAQPAKKPGPKVRPQPAAQPAADPEPAAARVPHNKFEPTAKLTATVRAMVAYGIPQDQICLAIGITKPTLHKYFREALDVAMVEANAKVAEALWKMAISGKSVAASIYWTKARMGWRDVQSVQQLDEHGNPIAPGATFVLKVER